jgi:hypothetical protein
MHRLIELNRSGKVRVPPDRLYGLSKAVSAKLAASGSPLNDEAIALAAMALEANRYGGGNMGRDPRPEKATGHLVARPRANRRRMQKAGEAGMAKICARRLRQRPGT